MVVLGRNLLNRRRSLIGQKLDLVTAEIWLAIVRLESKIKPRFFIQSTGEMGLLRMFAGKNGASFARSLSLPKTQNSVLSAFEFI